MADFDKVIPSGSEGKIGVKIVGFKIHPGRFTKSFTVTTNDEKNPKVVLKVTGTVKKVFDFTKSLSISGFADEDLAVETVITNQLTEPVNITGWHWSDKSREYDFLAEHIGVKLETIEKGRQYRLSTWGKKAVPAGQYNGDIVLETDFPNLPEKKFTFRMVITPEVQVHPSTVIMREMMVREGTSKSFEKVVSLIAARGDSLKILEVIPSRDDIAVNVQEVRPGKAFSCKLSIRPPSVAGKYEGSITFRTNYPGYEEIVAEIRGTVRVETK
ncbi:MAG TPA: hypothetical protein VLA34_05090 [Candidatus Krumholzibacterium sp.]|nr:hypothetical protein [Candidatus Krumholzibacterium sp.]